MVVAIARRRGLAMPRTTAELYEVATDAMIERASAPPTPATLTLLRAVFFEAHAREQRVITMEHIEAAARTVGHEAVGELVDLVTRDQLPLVRLLEKEPLQMQAAHLSFQEFGAMRALCEIPALQLRGFAWSAWWTNAARMGVECGSEFGRRFVEAVGMEDSATQDVTEGEQWRVRVVSALVGRKLEAAWMPVVVEAARGVEVAAARAVALELVAEDELRVGTHVLATDEYDLWKPAVVAPGRSARRRQDQRVGRSERVATHQGARRQDERRRGARALGVGGGARRPR